MSNLHRYTSEEVNYLKTIIKGRSTAEITKLFNAQFGLTLSRESIRAAIKNRGLSSGHDCRFKKGHTPMNHKPVGSERVNVYGYIEIKTAEPNTWLQKNRVVWEKANGPIPEKHVILFADGNGQNVGLDNLLLVSKRQLAILNHSRLLQKDKEMNKTTLLIADLILKISDSKRRAKKQKT